MASAASSKFPPATDLNKWRLNVCEGRQYWTYESHSKAEQPQNVIDKYHVGLDIVSLMVYGNVFTVYRVRKPLLYPRPRPLRKPLAMAFASFLNCKLR